MNVYDFDKTIYKNDSTVDFYFFILRRHPSGVFLLPLTAWSALLWAFRIIDKTQFKENFYKFLGKIENIDSEVETFWDKNERKIKDIYKKRHSPDDVIISASPEFLLLPICRRLGIRHLIASRVDKKNGHYSGKNCYGKEKVQRFYEVFGESTQIDEFYSDSLSDTPLADIARKSYIVQDETLVLWNEFIKSQDKKHMKHFLSREFLLFAAIGCINTFNTTFFSWIYSLLINPNLSFSAGYLTSLSIAYVLNSKVNFSQNLKFSKYIKFCVSYIPNFLIQNAAVFLFYNLLHWYKLVAYILAALIGIPVTFMLVKLFAFKQ